MDVHIKDIHHFSVMVRDMEESLRFYVDTLGFALKSRDPHVDAPCFSDITGLQNADMEAAFIHGYGLVIELLEYRNPPPVPMWEEPNSISSSHLCFTVENLEAAYDHFQAMGLALISAKPVKLPQGYEGTGSFLFRDPNGYILECMTVAGDTGAQQ